MLMASSVGPERLASKIRTKTARRMLVNGLLLRIEILWTPAKRHATLNGYLGGK